MDTDAILLLVVVVTALAAAFFTVVPVLPGSLLVPLGAAACALVAGWDEFSWLFWIVQAMFVLAAFAVDQAAQVIGVRRAGGSRYAMWGGAIGVFAGPFVLAFVLGPLALLAGPPIGAVLGTIAGQELGRSRVQVADGDRIEPRGYHRLGAVALMAYAIGTGVKLVLVAVQVAVLLAAVT